MSVKCAFLDADGVLNVAPIRDGHPVSPRKLEELVIPAEVKPALLRLKKAGFLLICVTNKPDIERGFMTQTDVDAIYNKLRHELPLDDIFICYSDKSDCYKPQPGMLLAAAKKYDINLTTSYMIGDRWRDVGAGYNAGCRTVWIDRNYNEQKPNPPANFVTYSLTEAVEWILTQ